MRPFPLCFALALSVLQMVRAQAPSRWQVNVRAGINLSRETGSGAVGESYLVGLESWSASPISLYINDIGGTHWRPGGVLGLSAARRLGRVLWLRGELNVEQKGSAIKVSRALTDALDEPVLGRFGIRMTYLTAPLLVQAVFGRVAVYAGPYLAYKLEEQQTGKATINGRTYSLERGVTRHGHADTGVVVGTSYRLADRWGLDLRYAGSTTTTLVGGPVLTLRNQSLQLTTTYRISH